MIIPIIKQGNEEKIFNCHDIERTTKIFIFGLVHTFHEEMPKQDIKNYIKDVDFLNDMEEKNCRGKRKNKFHLKLFFPAILYHLFLR